MQTLGLVAGGAFETVLFYSSVPVSAVNNSFTERDQRFDSYLLLRRVIQTRSWRQISTADKSKCFVPRLGKCRVFLSIGARQPWHLGPRGHQLGGCS
jgi:hypothetical protein